jgi:hypothetical protein
MTIWAYEMVSLRVKSILWPNSQRNVHLLRHRFRYFYVVCNLKSVYPNECLYGIWGKFPNFLHCRRRMMDVVLRLLHIQGRKHQPEYVESLGFRLIWTLWRRENVTALAGNLHRGYSVGVLSLCWQIISPHFLHAITTAASLLHSDPFARQP